MNSFFCESIVQDAGRLGVACGERQSVQILLGL